MFKIAKDSAVKARIQAVNQLRAVLVRADPWLRESLAGLGPVALVRRCADLPATSGGAIDTAAAEVLRTLARSVLQLSAEIRTLQQRIVSAVTSCAPGLLDRHGVDPDTAAALLIAAGDN